MECLIVAATEVEIRPLLEKFGLRGMSAGKPAAIRQGNSGLCFLVTGVGMMHAAFHLQRILSRKSFDHAIQAGIAGTFDRSLQIGEVVSVYSQRFGDLGALDKDRFIDVYDMKLADPDESPFRNGMLFNDSGGRSRHPGLREASALSVNRVSSTAEEIQRLKSKYHDHLEVMEGVAFHFACLEAGQSYAEIRCISNNVEPRNKDNWDIPGAVEQLNNYLFKWINENVAL